MTDFPETHPDTLPLSAPAEFPLHIECLAGGLRVMCAKQASGNF